MTAYLPQRIRKILCVTLPVSVILVSGCFNHVFYHPNQILYESPEKYRLKYEDVFFESRDSQRLHGWFIPAVADAIGTVIHFHGNFGNITYHLKQIHWLPSNRYNVFTFDYRGFGRSGGTPSKSGLYQDSLAAFQYIISRSDIDPQNIFVFGQSLGAVNAIVALANSRFPEIRAVAIEGAFSSYRNQVRDTITSDVQGKMGNVPCLSLQVWPIALFSVTNDRSAEDYVDQISPVPLLLIHCAEDSLVSYQHSERLFEKSNHPKRLWIIRGCNHLNVFTENPSEKEYRLRLIQFFNRYRV